MRKFRGRISKNSPTVLSSFWTKVHQIWGHVGKSRGLTIFSPIVDIMFRCRDMFGQCSKLGLKNGYFAPSPRKVNAKGFQTKFFK